MAEHLLHCHPIIFYVLLKLFKAIVSHRYVPMTFGAGIVIPLLKNAGLDKSNMDNYRAITISPVISKVFESYLLCTMQNFVFTSELQFGFKANKGCRDAMSVLCNTRDGSIVNIACLDMSTAFDRVNFYALSSKLVKLSVPKSFISIILDWYGKVLVSVKWNNSVSAPRRLLAGVHQAG